MTCQCFTCRHKDKSEEIIAYYKGYIEASDWFLNWAKRNKVPVGHIEDDDLPGIIAQIKLNRDETACLLDDITERIKNGSENF